MGSRGIQTIQNWKGEMLIANVVLESNKINYIDRSELPKKAQRTADEAARI